MPLISVIIPTYNRASQLDATLASLVRQSRTDFQVIVVDHASTDSTERIAQTYKETLQLSYYKIARDDIHFAGIPRDFGARRAETPFLLFLDTGMVVPSWFIHAHITFHHRYPEHVGIGLQHGYQGLESFQEDTVGANATEEQAASLLEQIAIDDAYEGIKQKQLQDQREGIDLATSHIPWFFGWSANLSLSRVAYELAGGFDLELEGWGFEDVDLCYRLFKHGQKLSFVQDGWGIELPQPRQPMIGRLQSHHLNQLRCYDKQRSVALEALLLTQLQLRGAVQSYYERPVTTENQEHIPLTVILDQLRTQIAQYSEEMAAYLLHIEPSDRAYSQVPEQILAQIAHPSLLIGGTVQDAASFDYVATGDEQLTSTSSIWSCWGIHNPLPDQSLETVVVSDIWTKLNWSLQFSFGLPGVPLLKTLIAEIKRTARKAIFLRPSSLSEQQESLVRLLEETCQTYDLDFQILVSTPGQVLSSH